MILLMTKAVAKDSVLALANVAAVDWRELVRVDPTDHRLVSCYWRRPPRERMPRVHDYRQAVVPDGAVVETFTSAMPEDEDERRGRLYLTAEAGMNAFQWPMRHPSGTKIAESSFHGPARGPLAR